jgi:hypothetical protein
MGSAPITSTALDLDLDPFAQRVDGRNTHAVQAAGDLVAAAVELAARVQRGHHQLQSGYLLLRVGGDRDTPAVVAHRDTLVFANDDLNLVARTGQRLVDGVIHHLVNQVVQRLDVGAADIHTRPAAHRLQAFQDLYIFCIVTGNDSINHVQSPGKYAISVDNKLYHVLPDSSSRGRRPRARVGAKYTRCGRLWI